MDKENIDSTDLKPHKDFGLKASESFLDLTESSFQTFRTEDIYYTIDNNKNEFYLSAKHAPPSGEHARIVLVASIKDGLSNGNLKPHGLPRARYVRDYSDNYWEGFKSTSGHYEINLDSANQLLTGNVHFTHTRSNGDYAFEFNFKINGFHTT